MEIMMMMDSSELNALRRDFETQRGGLTLVEFVSTMLNRIHDRKEDDLSMASSLVELFKQVDVNGDGTMEWEEFSAFCIEAGTP